MFKLLVYRIVPIFEETLVYFRIDDVFEEDFVGDFIKVTFPSSEASVFRLGEYYSFSILSFLHPVFIETGIRSEFF